MILPDKLVALALLEELTRRGQDLVAGKDGCSSFGESSGLYFEDFLAAVQILQQAGTEPSIHKCRLPSFSHSPLGFASIDLSNRPAQDTVVGSKLMRSRYSAGLMQDIPIRLRPLARDFGSLVCRKISHTHLHFIHWVNIIK